MRKSTGTMDAYIDWYLASSRDVRAYYPTRQGNDLDGWLVAVKTPL
ncbi:hypothetical protein [Bacillus sp. 2205SS5-2]